MKAIYHNTFLLYRDTPNVRSLTGVADTLIRDEACGASANRALSKDDLPTLLLPISKICRKNSDQICHHMFINVASFHDNNCWFCCSAKNLKY